MIKDTPRSYWRIARAYGGILREELYEAACAELQQQGREEGFNYRPSRDHSSVWRDRHGSKRVTLKDGQGRFLATFAYLGGERDQIQLERR
jgi:hypothetical protein